MYYLKYKNYYTCIHYSKENKLFYGKLEGINDSVSFDGDSLSLIEQNFKNTVETYTNICVNTNKIPETPKYIPQILKNNIIVNTSKSFRDYPFQKIVGYDKDTTEIIIKVVDNTFKFYSGINIIDFENNWTNNVDDIKIQLKQNKKDLEDSINFLKILNKKIPPKTLNAYYEIISQLKYISIFKNSKVYQFYKKEEQQLLKGKKRKEKYMYRFLTQEEMSQMKCFQEEKKYFTLNDKELKLKNIEELEKELSKYI